MSGFKALNIESDSESDISIDDTKEIQIEDALKLYQNAIQAHSKAVEGGVTADFEIASRAYEALFASDIFTWPESQTELRRLEIHGPSFPHDDLIAYDEEKPVAFTSMPAGGNGDSGPSTLPQILHLSHKNFAQFKLEALSAQLDYLNASLKQVVADASVALKHYVGALDKDEGDLDLWRRSAAVGEILDSQRIARFCLEAVLDGDDEALSGMLALPGLDEVLASERLQEIVATLQDNLSLMQMPVASSQRKAFPRAIRSRLAPYEKLISTHRSLREMDHNRNDIVPQPHRVLLKAPETWAELGELLLTQQKSERAGLRDGGAGSVIGFELSRQQTTGDAHDRNLFNSAASVRLHSTISKLPESLEAIFPGLDKHNITVQPHIADADPSMTYITRNQPLTHRKSSSPHVRPTKELPTRKRSADAATLQDKGEDEGRSKSRRIRARDSTIDNESNRQALIEANIRWEYEQQLNELQAADDWMYDTTGALFERVGVLSFNMIKNVRQELEASDTPSETTTEGMPMPQWSAMKGCRADFKAFLSAFDERAAQLLLVSLSNLDWSQESILPGSANLLGSNNPTKDIRKRETMQSDGLNTFLQHANNSWLLTHGLAQEWITALLTPDETSQTNSYVHHIWPDALKTMVVRVLVNFDSALYRNASDKLQISMKHTGGSNADLIELTQAAFELHLDIYCLIKDPSSGVNIETITEQSDRLCRWSELAREALHFRAVSEGSLEIMDALNLRFLWAITLQINASGESTRNHVIDCLQDLRTYFTEAENPVVFLPNNAVMPELSLAALDREISVLTTKDFFDKVTNPELSDPVAIIESLEPLLNALEEEGGQTAVMYDSDLSNPSAFVSQELVSFLLDSQLSTRLSLWQRLRNAYAAIDYPPMLIYCYFRMTRLLLQELRDNKQTNGELLERQTILLRSLGLIKNYVAQISQIAQSSESPYECLNDETLRSAVTIMRDVLSLLQVFVVHEDSIRVGQSQAPSDENGLADQTFDMVADMIHDTQLHVWMIMYGLLKETVAQNAEMFPTPPEDKFDFLRSVHRNLGIRKICGGVRRKFVRMLKDEFYALSHVDGYDSEQAQVLYDLFGLNCFIDPAYELMEHNCSRDPFIDRSAAMQAVDLLLSQVSKMPMKDLIKHPIKDTIDRVHGAIARKKPTEAILRNREIYRSFLRSPIRPVDIFQALQGLGNELAMSHIPQSDAVLASKGWYFLMGHISLSKFRIPKRNGPTPTEDVDIAIAFFMQDLEYSMENWETWYRLAQAYDAKIEESVIWSADKLNNNMIDLVGLQRAAIHSYTMATALAYRSAEASFETSEKMTEMFLEFGTRLYSSSREPFSMKAFALDDLKKYLSTSTAGGRLPEVKPFKSLREYTCWKLAKELFQRAIPGKPDSWILRYQLGKCLWKMFNCEKLEHHDSRPDRTQILECFVKAIELAPGKKEHRDSRREPPLEPHYKLVSIVYKMVRTGGLSLEQAVQVLEQTSYAAKITRPEHYEDIHEFIASIFVRLRSADKSHWHHRMIYRAAKLVLDKEDPPGTTTLTRAKEELTKQMFTRTMVLQVWRPDSERAGRHFVYTTRYTRLFMQTLTGLKDRNSLEQLAKRVRKRPHDLFEHSNLWSDLCNAYMGLLREHGHVDEGLETACFSTIAHEDFTARKDLLEKWMQEQPPGSSATLDVLRDVQELKKTNQGLMKPGAIDDMIGDSYALLFSTIGKQLLEEQRTVKQEDSDQPHPALSSPPRPDAMSISSMMNIDGTNELKSKSSLLPNTALFGTQTPNELSEQAPARKKVGVGRREIRAAAEACSQKPATAPTGPSTKSGPPGNVRVEVVIHASKPNTSIATSRESSVTGSIHDSADDESELSELEEADDEEDEDEENDEATGERASDGDVAMKSTRTPSPSPSQDVEGLKADAEASSSQGSESEATKVDVGENTAT
ncbi:hypothetical protein K431DRAFT_265218 [Polychaeton citri CBS 116435]|uniref:Histone transcription regulator 3 homolog n=1 Tax=Polychaeton citri CBS 116435 TaxID=1314669 RepID=A0A9P4Q9K7_9PEZI|nr:hypothetical protein K431DRAFT_265218 [Polychaeton citri CBS 116435]